MQRTVVEQFVAVVRVDNVSRDLSLSLSYLDQNSFCDNQNEKIISISGERKTLTSAVGSDLARSFRHVVRHCSW